MLYISMLYISVCKHLYKHMYKHVYKHTQRLKWSGSLQHVVHLWEQGATWMLLCVCIGMHTIHNRDHVLLHNWHMHMVGDVQVLVWVVLVGGVVGYTHVACTHIAYLYIQAKHINIPPTSAPFTSPLPAYTLSFPSPHTATHALHDNTIITINNAGEKTTTTLHTLMQATQGSYGDALATARGHVEEWLRRYGAAYTPWQQTKLMLAAAGASAAAAVATHAMWKLAKKEGGGGYAGGLESRGERQWTAREVKHAIAAGHVQVCCVRCANHAAVVCTRLHCV